VKLKRDAVPYQGARLDGPVALVVFVFLVGLFLWNVVSAL
jgi:hypothetical protein